MRSAYWAAFTWEIISEEIHCDIRSCRWTWRKTGSQPMGWEERCYMCNTGNQRGHFVEYNDQRVQGCNSMQMELECGGIQGSQRNRQWSQASLW